MHRLAEFEQHVVGHVHQQSQTAHAGTAQPFTHPLRRLRVRVDRLDDAPGITGTSLDILDFDRDARFAAALDRLDRGSGVAGAVDRRQFARQAENAECIATVGREFEFEYPVVELQGRLDRLTGFERSIEFEQAVGLFRQAQLLGRAQHAAGFDAPQLGATDLHAARQHRTGQRQRCQQTRACIRRTAHDLVRSAVAGIDLADPKPVGVGMLYGFDDAADDHAVQRFGQQRHGFTFDARHGQAVRDIVRVVGQVHPFAQPIEADFHDSGSRFRVHGRSGELTQKAQIVVEEQTQIVDAVTPHREPLHTHTKGIAGIAF